MYQIKLKRTSKNEYDEIITFENKDKAQVKYLGYEESPFFYVSLVKVVSGREQIMASFCNSKFA
jgi:hypothetical protein